MIIFFASVNVFEVIILDSENISLLIFVCFFFFPEIYSTSNVILDTKLLEKSEFTEDLGVHDSVYKDINTSTIIEDTIKNEEAGDIFMPM